MKVKIFTDNNLIIKLINVAISNCEMFIILVGLKNKGEWKNGKKLKI